MTTEEKAKAYDEALERAKELWNSPRTCFDINQLTDIFSELKESEDERIRRALIRHLKELRDWKVGTMSPIKVSSHYDVWIAYLEKQKDASKAIEAVDRIDKYIDEHLANAHDMKDSNPDKKYYRGWDDVLGKMSEILQDVYSNEKPKEQKPVDLSEMMVHKEPYIAPVPTPMVADEQKPIILSDKFEVALEEFLMNARDKSEKTFAEDVKEYADRLREIVINEKKEQKPAEWKPQPESLEALMYAIEGKWEMIKPTSYLSRRLEDLYDGLVNTYNVNETLFAELPKTAYTAEDIEELKVLKDKIDASMDEKSAEWSEEDEKMRNLIVATFEVNHPDGFFKANELGTTGMRGVHTEEIVSWLKSLPERFTLESKQEWSEEDKLMIKCCLRALEYYKYTGKPGQFKPAQFHVDGDLVSVEKVESWLKSLRPVSKESLQPHWKPSEEQIYAIVEALKYLPNNKDEWMILNTLVDVFKKLM